ncbi:MAG: LysE/ArgO family amino acid transporter [Paracoccus sp. (in: a-proteobacteria)]
MHAYLAGLATGLSLIVAIGAQNAFVLKQGLLRRHVLAVCLFCAASDAALITLGVPGTGRIAALAPWATVAMTLGGAVFLICYGARSFLAAARGGEALRARASEGGAGLAATLAAIAMLTWANPHVWLDTVVLLGAVSAEFADKAAFAAGAITGSFAFFFALGYGARLLAPIFASPRAWQVLELFIGCIMWAIAARLLMG